MTSLFNIKQHLKKMDEVALLELLNIQSSDLVEAFSELIEERMEQLEKDIDENE